MWSKWNRNLSSAAGKPVICVGSGLNKLRMIQGASGSLKLRTAALCVSAFVWWGVLYPELCFTEGTCEQVILEKGREIVEEQKDCSGILDASGDEVVIRSRLLEWIEEKKNEYN